MKLLVDFLRLTYFFLVLNSFAHTYSGGYEKPSEAILKVLHTDLPAYSSMSPTGDRLMLLTPLRYQSIHELAQPYLRLAGLRVMPHNHSLHNSYYVSALQLVNMASGELITIKLPTNARISGLTWSPDGRRFAFAHDGKQGVELWIGNAKTGSIKKIKRVFLHKLFPRSFRWLADNRTILARVISANATGIPQPDGTIIAPSVQESIGDSTVSSTYEARDTLKNPHDEQLFQYYAQSQIVTIDIVRGTIKRLGKPGIYSYVSSSPNQRYLLVKKLRKPFSYLTTWTRFPYDIELWNHNGQRIACIASVPLADKVPIRGVPTGPRNFHWRDNEPDTIIYLEALDGGNPFKQVPHHDRVMMLRAPFQDPPQEIYSGEQRISWMEWTEKKSMMLVWEHDIAKRRSKTFLATVDTQPTTSQLLWDKSFDDLYGDPGTPLVRVQSNGAELVQLDGDRIYLSGQGSSSDGDRPFLDAFDLKTLKTERLFHSDKDHLEYFIGFLNKGSKNYVTRRESAKKYPNYLIRTLSTDAIRKLTDFPDPLPELREITKQIVTYKRSDGVDLSFTLYLPADYTPGTRLPTVMWAYPLDYSDAKVAGQVNGSPQEYTLPGWPLQLFFLQAGYAIIDDPALPVIGDAQKIYDTYLEQIIAGANAAVNKAVAMGVTDRNRIGVMGHSHGALMTVNLLAHTNLFKAGIARSGSYNRSLTPFGFQSETRTLWEAPQVYQKVSPFFVANQIKLPLLLIHGNDDSNPGTTPLQSQKLFEAIRANGGKVRLVQLPYESHWYRAKESLEHTIAESINWFDTHVKNVSTSAFPTNYFSPLRNNSFVRVRPAL